MKGCGSFFFFVFVFVFFCGSYPVEVYGKLGESVISVCKKAQKGLKDAFNGCEKVENTLFDLSIF